jgi:CheY-like chemotaxis protein
VNRNIKILIADDHAPVREAIVSLLSEFDFVNIQQAVNGIEVLQMVKIATPDLILMDINMPNMDGITATRLVKKLVPQIKVIGLSCGDLVLIEKMNEAGSDDFVTKERAIEHLYPAIQRIFMHSKEDSETEIA